MTTFAENVLPEEKDRASSEIENRRRNTMIGLFLGGLLSIPAFAETAFARVAWKASAEKGSAELVQVDVKTGKETRMRLVSSVEEIGSHPTTEKLVSPMFEHIRRVNIPMLGVNETMRDPDQWKAFVWNEAKTFGFDPQKKQALHVPKALELAIKIATKNLNYPLNLNPQSTDYDPLFEQNVNALPIDEIAMNPEHQQGACRHFSVLLDKVFTVFTDDPDTRYLRNVILRTLNTEDQQHALNVVIELDRDEKGVDDIKSAYIDTTLGNPWKGSDFKLRYFQSAVQEKTGIAPLYRSYIEQTLFPRERIDAAKQWDTPDHYAARAGLIHDMQVAFTYLGVLGDLYRKNDPAQAEEIFRDFQKFVQPYSLDDVRFAEREEYDLLNSIFFNIYKSHARFQSTRDSADAILNEGRTLRLKSLHLRFTVLKKQGDALSLRAGEEYGDFLGQTGDYEGAQAWYLSLFDGVQTGENGELLTQRAIPSEQGPDQPWITIKPYQNRETLKKYMDYKREFVWQKK